MSKKQQNPLNIFIHAAKLYFLNIKQFMKYMAFPVFGQVLGLILVFFMTYAFSVNMPFLIQKFSILDNFSVLTASIIIVSLPGLIIFMKAFWEYLVAYGAVNSMLENLLKSGRVYDFSAHTELIKRRTVPFVGLWFLFGIFTLIAICPFLWVPAGVCAVFFVLIFQVFTLEPDLSPVGCVKKSFNLIKGHFAQTFILMFLAGMLTYVLFPQVVLYAFEKLGISLFISKMLIPVVESLPVNELNNILSVAYIPPLKVEDIAYTFVTVTIAQLLIQYTLPFRSVLFGLWYKELGGSFVSAAGKKKTSRKRPSEKLMEESHKKFSSKRLDKNILKRAMEKDDED